MTRMSWLAEFARRLTSGLRAVHDELETRVERLILEGCPYDPYIIAAGVTEALIECQFGE